MTEHKKKSLKIKGFYFPIFRFAQGAARARHALELQKQSQKAQEFTRVFIFR
jgi:hypothetical protein